MHREAMVGFLLLASACASSRVPETRPLVGGGSEVDLSRIVEAALEADARAESADSIYAPYATVVADGRLRRGPPRFAGIGEQGEVAVTNTQTQISSTTAWAEVGYRWLSDRSNRAQAGRALFVLVPAQNRLGWRIVQLHSSTVR
jgi:hypothetical protein